MSDRPGHDAVRELLAMAALDALSPSEQRMLDAHLATCETCTRELAELRDSVASIGAALPARPMSAGARFADSRAAHGARSPRSRERDADSQAIPPRLHRRRATHRHVESPCLAGWLAAAALLIAAGAVAYGLRSARQRLSSPTRAAAR